MKKDIDFDPVAELYDLYARSTFDLAFWKEVVGASAPPRLELMCGTGRITLAVLQAGHSIEGLDHSAGMLEALRRKLRQAGLDAPLYHADAKDLRLPHRCGLIFIGFNAIAEVLDDGDKARVFRGVREHLAPGGRFWVTIHNPPVRRPLHDGREVALGRYDVPGTGEVVEVSGTYRLLEGTSTVEGSQRYVCTRGGAITRRIEVPMRFDLPEPERLERLLGLTGFQVESRFGDYDRSPFDPRASPYLIVSCAVSRAT